MAIQSKLSRFDLTMLIVSFVIGIGIFQTPALVAEKAGTPAIFYTAWVLGGIISLFGALTFAEIGTRLPVAGGYYKIFSQCYHPAFAFMLNWAVVITNAGSAVGVALVGSNYIAPVIVPLSWQHIISPKLIAASVLAIIFGFNYLGIKMGSRVQNVLSMLKIVMILSLCLAVFGSKNPIPNTNVMPAGISPLEALGMSLISIFFTFGGYWNTVNLGADIQNPKRNIPLGIFSGIAIVITLYLLINIAYCQVLGFDKLKTTQLPAAELARTFFGDYGFKAISIIVFCSVLGFINSSFMHNPRVYYAMAEDKVLPSFFKEVNEDTQTQEFGLSFFFILTAISIYFFSSFKRIVNYVEFIDTLSLVFAAGAIFILRRQKSGLEYDGYKVFFYPLVPILFILVQAWACVSVFVSDVNSALAGLVIFICGFPLYHLLRRVL
jgi:APA family basic amino acid/polyamine antiporter